MYKCNDCGSTLGGMETGDCPTGIEAHRYQICGQSLYRNGHVVENSTEIIEALLQMLIKHNNEMIELLNTQKLPRDEFMAKVFRRGDAQTS